jgi:hypothetical protein
VDDFLTASPSTEAIDVDREFIMDNLKMRDLGNVQDIGTEVTYNREEGKILPSQQSRSRACLRSST